MQSRTDDLAYALNVLAEDRLTEADIAFDLAYEEALKEDLEQTQRLYDKRRDELIDTFFYSISLYLERGTLIKNDKRVWTLVGGEDRFPVADVVSMWNFPRSIETRSLNKKRFAPGPKSGLWNYKKIAEELSIVAAGVFRQRRANRERKSNETVAGELKQELGLKGYTGLVRASSLADRPVFVKYEISLATTVDKAERIVRFLRDEGLLSDGMFDKDGKR